MKPEKLVMSQNIILASVKSKNEVHQENKESFLVPLIDDHKNFTSHVRNSHAHMTESKKKSCETKVES